MYESSKVRLVRCPKCQNLLPEVTDYALYQCGGCGAVLRAKNKRVDLDTLSEKSESNRVGGISDSFSENCEKLNIPEKRMMDLSDGSESDLRSNISSSSRGERRRILFDRADNYGTRMMSKGEKRAVDRPPDEKADDLCPTNVAEDFEDLKMHNENGNGLRRSEYLEWRNRERSQMEGFRRAQRMDVEGMRYAASIYSEEGSSDHKARSNDDYADPMINKNDKVGFNKVDYAGDDRSEILRKIDELTDQLSRSGDMVDKAKEKVSLDRRTIPEDPYVGSEKWYYDGSSGMNMASMQYSYSDKQFGRPPNRNHYAEPSTLMHRQEMTGHGFYPPRYAPSHIQGFGDPIESQMLGRDPCQPPAPFRQYLSHTYFSGEYTDRDMVYMDQMESYPPNVGRHRPSCSCFHCHSRRQISPPVPPAAFSDKRFSDVPDDVVFNHYENPGSFGPRGYDSRIISPPTLKSHNPQFQRLTGDLTSEVDDFICGRPPTVRPAFGRRRCRPIAGAAPFLACYNCFELLQLPKKFMTEDENKNKMRCGACSTIIVFTVYNKKLAILIPAEQKNTLEKVDESPDLVSKEGNSYARGHLNRANTTFSSYDYDNGGYDFQSMDRELGSLSAGQASPNKSAEMNNLCSASSCTSDAEEDDSMIALRKNSASAELATKRKGPLHPPASPLQDPFNYEVNRFGGGNGSEHVDGDKAMRSKTTVQQNSMNSTSQATEIDILSNEYSNTGTSLDSGEARGSRTAESFFAGMIKKSFKDSNRSNQPVEQEKANVTVNGHLIPDRLIQKAQKLAGPIYPGNYWYDFRAGFWGAMGGPCLGIIPPFIAEFNYPMAKNCAGGNTSVFVNGRELHPKDMKLLGSRGLPTDRDGSYIIEISGRVLDEETGEELESLGKLAPTMEKAKRGFGMRAPKAAA